MYGCFTKISIKLDFLHKMIYLLPIMDETEGALLAQRDRFPQQIRSFCYVNAQGVQRFCRKGECG